MIASDVIKQALRIMGVIAAGQTPSGADADTALEYLRDLFAEWRSSGIEIPDFSIAAQSSTLSIAAADKQAVAFQLAMRLAPEYGWEPSPTIVASAEESMNRMRLRYFPIIPVDYSVLPVYYDEFDITTG